jgi:hypothetical protein
MIVELRYMVATTPIIIFILLTYSIKGLLMDKDKTIRRR